MSFVFRDCLQCGQPFSFHSSQLNSRDPMWCSRKCYQESRPQKRKIVCDACKKEFLVQESQFAYRNPRWCSHKCAGTDEESKKKVSIQFKGKRLEDIVGVEKAVEMRLHFSQSRKGRTHPNFAWAKGTLLSAETKERIAAKHRGKIASLETRKRISRNSRKEDAGVAAHRRRTRTIFIHEKGIIVQKGQVVHHIDGNPKNNDVSNLQLMESEIAHARLHDQSRIRDAFGRYT